MAPSEGIPLSPSGTTRLYGIMGYPIAHSLSPLMQTFAFNNTTWTVSICLFLLFPNGLPRRWPVQSPWGCVASM